MIYCKGVVDFLEVLGSSGVENVAYLKLNIWTPEGEKCFGTVLVNSIFEL